MTDSKFEQGLQVRREVLGDAHVDRAEANKTSFDADFQRIITEFAWGSVWTGTTIDRQTRHLLTLAILAALGRENELALHVRATQNTGVTPEQIREAFHQVAVYAGIPAANSAFATAKKIFADLAKDAGAPAGETHTPSEEPVAATQRQGSLDWTVQPPYYHEPYQSTIKRAPQQPLVPLAHTLSELTGPVYGHDSVRPLDNDLTRNAAVDGEAIGERIIVTGRVLDEHGRPVRNALLEIWQANACGRYIHKHDQHDAPLDPNFTGAGRVLTDQHGVYRFTTIRPGAYPWKNHPNAWRPAHIHFSIFGESFLQRLVTQMYFSGDPLLPLDPIYNSIPDEKGRQRLVAVYDHTITEPLWALGYCFDIVLAGGQQTPFERE